MKTLLWLDNARDPLTDDWLVFSPIEKPYQVVWVKKYFEFVDYITQKGLSDAICFDHDLSDIHCYKRTYKEKTGYDCAKWLTSYCKERKLSLPLFGIQSANETGRNNIENELLNYIYENEK